MLEALFFNWIPIGISIVSLTITIYMVKYRRKSTSEKVYDANRKSAIDGIFEHLKEIDNHKLAIYANIEICTSAENSRLQYTNDIFYNIEAYQELIESGGKQLFEYVYESEYFTDQQCESIKGYVWSACNFLELAEPGFYQINKNLLDFHKYGAYMIIKQFGKLTDENFKYKWQPEFASGVISENEIDFDDTIYYGFHDFDDFDDYESGTTNLKF